MVQRVPMSMAAVWAVWVAAMMFFGVWQSPSMMNYGAHWLRAMASSRWARMPAA